MEKNNNKNKSNKKDTKEKIIKTEKKEIDKDKVILSIQNASYRYSDAAEDEYALRDVSYDFEKGKIYAIRGRSGTGKTTLLSLISGLERCTEGSIIFDGKDLKDLNLDTYRNSQIDRITIFDGTETLEVTGYAEYSFLEEKSYKTQPIRIQNGAIEEIEEYATFLTPRLIIKYNMMGIDDYRSLMKMLKRRNSFIVNCYDVVEDKIVKNEMYFATPSMPIIYQQYLTAMGIREYTIELIGTNTFSKSWSIPLQVAPSFRIGSLKVARYMPAASVILTGFRPFKVASSLSLSTVKLFLLSTSITK